MTRSTPRTRSSRPGVAITGVVIIAVGLTIVVSAVLAAIVGTDSSTGPPPSRAQTSSPGGEPEPEAAAGQQIVQTRDGSLSFEAPAEWTTRVDVSSSAAGTNVTGAGAVETTYNDYKAATTGGILAVVTDVTEPTSAGLMGALIGNSSLFCPPGGCTTGKPVEVDVKFPSPVTAVDTQLTLSDPASAGSPGEMRYTIETEAPTRYIVLIARSADPHALADVIEHAVATLTLN